jgi:hypothetical protein
MTDDVKVLTRRDVYPALIGGVELSLEEFLNTSGH